MDGTSLAPGENSQRQRAGACADVKGIFKFKFNLISKWNGSRISLTASEAPLGGIPAV